MYKNYRNIYENGIYHVFNRGVNKDKIFKSRADYKYLMNKIDFYSKITGVVVVVYSLLPNHYHFVLREPSYPGLDYQPRVGINQYMGSGISKFMGFVAHSYTRYFNYKYKRSGRLFEYVFKSREVRSDKQLETIVDYVYYNSVKHGLVECPEDYEYTKNYPG